MASLSEYFFRVDSPGANHLFDDLQEFFLPGFGFRSDGQIGRGIDVSELLYAKRLYVSVRVSFVTHEIFDDRFLDAAG